MIDIIHRLRRTSSRKAKFEILESEYRNKEWKMYLQAVYNPYINYYITSTDDVTFYTADQYKTINLLKMLTDITKLSNRQITGNDAKVYARMLSREYGELFRLILARSLDAGITANSINKVYPGLIPDFKVMLGKDVEVSRFPVKVSMKFDGVRLIAIVDDGKVTLHTRSGKVLELDSLKAAMARLPDGVYDGELVAGDGNVASRTRITGEVNKILKGSSTSIKDYTYCIFDRLSVTEWKERKGITNYKHRYSFLQIVNRDVIPSLFNVKIVEQYMASDQAYVTFLFEQYIDNGFEGIICRYDDDFYEWKRSNALIKKKAIRECVLYVRDVVEGKGKYKGMIGALECGGSVNNKIVEVKVGSGLSDFDREKHPDYYKGKEIEVCYNEIVKSPNGYSLFLPRFKRRVNDV